MHVHMFSYQRGLRKHVLVMLLAAQRGCFGRCLRNLHGCHVGIVIVSLFLIEA